METEQKITITVDLYVSFELSDTDDSETIANMLEILRDHDVFMQLVKPVPYDGYSFRLLGTRAALTTVLSDYCNFELDDIADAFADAT